MKKKVDQEIKNGSFFAQGPVVTALLLFILLGTTVVGFRTFQEQSKARKVTDFKTCKEAGYGIMESYPAQCKGPNGKIYMEEISPTPSGFVMPNDKVTVDFISGTPAPYEGYSTGSACNSNADCVANGCNKEICQSTEEESMASICVYREDTPLRMGYSCGCVAQKCAWTK